jgi:hypothetical protein
MCAACGTVVLDEDAPATQTTCQTERPTQPNKTIPEVDPLSGTKNRRW